MRGWGEIDGLTDEHLCSDCFLRISEFDVSSSSGSHLLHTGMSALDVLSNAAVLNNEKLSYLSQLGITAYLSQ